MPGISTCRATPIATIMVACVLSACSRTADAPQPQAAAPAASAQSTAVVNSENVHSIRIGELSALALRDGAVEFPNDNKVFAVGRTPGEVAAVLSAAGLPTDQLQLSIQPLLVKTSDRVLLFDAGAGGAFGPGAGKLGDSLAEAGIDPRSVTDVFISHSHGDHVGGLVDAQGALRFPDATLHISQPEWDFLADASGAVARGMGEHHAPFVAALTPKVAAFVPGAELVPGVVTAVEIKGHTPGHSGYRITSGSESLLYVGDAMHHYIVSVQRPQWTIAFDGDATTAEASRAALIAEAAADGQRIYAVHFPFPGIGSFTRQGEGFAWLVE